MNVALTRARRSLIVLGNVGRLSSDGTWKALVDHSKSRERLEPDAVKARTSGGGSGGGGDGEALCARLEETASGKKWGRDRSGDRQGTGRNRAGRGGRGEVDDAVGSRVADSSDKKEIQAPRRAAGSRMGGHGRGDGSGGINVPDDRVAAAAVAPAVTDIEKHCADKRANPRHEPESGGSGQRRKPSSRGGDQVRPSARLEESVRDRPPVEKRQQRHEEAGGAKPTPRGSACKRPDGGAANRPQKRARVNGQEAAKRVSTPDGGFLGGLLSSLSSNAGGIASGKEHDFRQGLRGGEDDERRRAAAAPRLGGARVTELSRPVERKQAQSARHSSRAAAAAAATGRQTPVESDDRGGRGSHRGGGSTEVVPPSTQTDARNGGRAVGTSSANTMDARRVAPSTARRDASSARDYRSGRNQFGGGENQHRQPPPQPSEQRKRARRVEPAAATGVESSGASSRAGVGKQIPASRRPGASGSRSGGKSGGAKKTGSEASRGGGATSVLDILQGISDTWGDSKKK
ncbi:unnamed protein product [Ectocarpus sp. 12 AP-2014]